MNIRRLTTAVAGLMLHLAVGAQASYEDLGPVDQMRYNACTEAASARPTPEGVVVGMSTCTRRFLSGPPSAESVAKSIAKEFNQPPPALGDTVLSATAESAGKQVIVRYVVRSSVLLPNAKTKIESSALATGCPQMMKEPAFSDGGVTVTYIYDTDRGERVAMALVSARTCLETWRYPPKG